MLEICEIGKQGWPSRRWFVLNASTSGECRPRTVSEDSFGRTAGVTKTQPANVHICASNGSRLRLGLPPAFADE